MDEMLIYYKGQSSDSFGIECLYDLPTISYASKKQDTWEIPGKDGLLYASEDLMYRGDAEFECTFSFISDEYLQDTRPIRKWLSGKGLLILSEVSDAYYEVKKVTIKSSKREIARYGRIKTEFILYPYEFIAGGDEAVSVSSTLVNEYDESLPIYEISGNGSGTLSVNGKTMTYTVSGKLYIDTRRKIAYDSNGNPKDGMINGDYNDLKLISGTNQISCTTGTLKVTPRWGYYL